MAGTRKPIHPPAKEHRWGKEFPAV